MVDGEIQLPKMFLKNGSYYIEISVDNNIYRTGISVNNTKKTKPNKKGIKGL